MLLLNYCCCCCNNNSVGVSNKRKRSHTLEDSDDSSCSSMCGLSVTVITVSLTTGRPGRVYTSYRTATLRSFGESRATEHDTTRDSQRQQQQQQHQQHKNKRQRKQHTTHDTDNNNTTQAKLSNKPRKHKTATTKNKTPINIKRRHLCYLVYRSRRRTLYPNTNSKCFAPKTWLQFSTGCIWTKNYGTFDVHFYSPTIVIFQSRALFDRRPQLYQNYQHSRKPATSVPVLRNRKIDPGWISNFGIGTYYRILNSVFLS